MTSDNSSLHLFNVILDALIAITPGKTNLNTRICNNNYHLESTWKITLD